MGYDELFSKAKTYGQEHIFNFWNELSTLQKEDLLHQVEDIDFDQVKYFNSIKNTKKEDPSPSSISAHGSISKDEIINSKEDIFDLGEDAIKNGSVACLLLAGGQGSRLGFDGSKGCFEIMPVTNKSLFESFAEQIIANEKKYDTTLNWYIMTSELNNNMTIDFFTSHDFFGLNKDRVHFFSQKTIPAIDEDGKLILASKHEIFKNPDGTAGVYGALKRNGLLDHANNNDIDYFSFINVDNPIVEIFDPSFIGLMIKNNSEFGSKVIKKVDPQEKVGLVCKVDDKSTILEYSNISEDLLKARTDDGELLLNNANLNILMIKRSFINKISSDDNIKYIVAHKQIPHLTSSGEFINPKQPNGYKFERLVFDAMPLANNTSIILANREDEFAPVKNASGNDSPQTSKEMVTNKAKRWMLSSGIDKTIVDELIFVEISPLFALTQNEFSKKINENLIFYENELIDAESFCFE